MHGSVKNHTDKLSYTTHTMTVYLLSFPHSSYINSDTNRLIVVFVSVINLTRSDLSVPNGASAGAISSFTTSSTSCISVVREEVVLIFGGKISSLRDNRPDSKCVAI